MEVSGTKKSPKGAWGIFKDQEVQGKGNYEFGGFVFEVGPWQPPEI
jgi:hypothetical protein